MGADKAVWCPAVSSAAADTYATSQILAAALEEDRRGRRDHRVLRPSGHRWRHRPGGSPDRREAEPAPGDLRLHEIKAEGKKITVQRMLEDGYMTIEVALPCLLTCIKELNEPRYMSVGGIVEAYSSGYEVLYNSTP